MLVSPIVNSVMFKDVSDQTYPNKDNTLHEDLKQGGFTTLPYYQKFNNGDTLLLQFVSDSAVVPSLKIWNPGLANTIAGTLVNTITGTVTRYYYNFDINLTSYNDSCIFFTITQGSDSLTSEPIQVLDLSDDLADGTIKYIKYNNQDRENADLSGYFVDWSTRDHMFFYIEAQDREPNQVDESEVLEGAQSQTIISATFYTGISLKTAQVPVYMSDRMIAVTSLDVFLVNGTQYVKQGEVESEMFGGSTSVQMIISLIEKNALGINVDDLGIENTDTMEWHKEWSSDTVSANFDIEEPDGYLVSNIMIQHAGTSVPSSVNVEIGYTVAGDEIADGVIWKSASRPTAFQPNSRDNFDAASRIYFTFSGGAGYVLRIKVLFQLNDIS